MEGYVVMREWERQAVILGNKKWKSERDEKINWTVILLLADIDKEELSA